MNVERSTFNAQPRRGNSLRKSRTSATDFRNGKGSADLPRQLIGDLGVSWYGFYDSGLWIEPQRVSPAFSFQRTPEPTKVFQYSVPLHPTEIASQRACLGTPRRASSRRSCKINSIESRRLSRHSGFVRPCPFAPGISAQKAINHSPSCSMTAVNSLVIRMLPPFSVSPESSTFDVRRSLSFSPKPNGSPPC